MESLSSLVFQYLHAIWRRKWIVALAAWAVCIVGWSVVAMIPSRYESTARVYVDADQLLTPLLQGISVDVDPAQQLDVLQRTLLSRPNMEELIHMADLDRTIKTAADKDALIQKLIQQIVIIPQTKNLFAIAYQDTDPTVARNVVQSLLTIFAENTAGTQRAQMDNAQKFLNDQIALYEQQLRDAEKRSADFRSAHLEVLSGAASAGSIDNLRKDLQTTKDNLQDAIVRRDEVQKSIDAMVPVSNVDATTSTSSTVVGGSVEGRLAQLQAQLADLRTRDTEQHPDVISVKNQIAELTAQLPASRRAAGASSSSSTATVTSASGTVTTTVRTRVSGVVYDQVRIRLVDAQSQVASLQRQVDQDQAELDRVTAIAQSQPGVEAQMEDMDRDYGILKQNYEQLLSRREATNLAEAADTQADKIQFRIVDAPQVPSTPFAPNRPMLFSVVLLAGVLGGLAIPILLTQIDRSYTTLQRLRGLGLPVLGGVTYVSLFKSRGQGMMETAGFGGATMALMMVYGVLIVMSVNLHRLLSGSLG
jgi:polysaccharide chain length determinant protein (PEP-CTERM system associated)